MARRLITVLRRLLQRAPLILALGGAAPAFAQVRTSSTAALLTQCRDTLLTCRRIAKSERAKRDEARADLATCKEQPPIVQTVEVEKMPAWGWGLIAGAAGVAAGAIAAGFAIGGR